MVLAVATVAHGDSGTPFSSEGLFFELDDCVFWVRKLFELWICDDFNNIVTTFGGFWVG